MTIWHVWQTTLTDPDQCLQFACPEEGDRPDGNPWTDPAPWPIRGQQTVIDHAGSVEGEPMTPYGLGFDTQFAIQTMAPTGVPLQTTVAVHFDGYQPMPIEASESEPEPTFSPDPGTDTGELSQAV